MAREDPVTPLPTTLYLEGFDGYARRHLKAHAAYAAGNITDLDAAGGESELEGNVGCNASRGAQAQPRRVRFRSQRVQYLLGRLCELRTVLWRCVILRT